MFTGIVQDIGRVVAVRPHDGDLALDIQPNTLNCESVNIGDSVAVAGVCLTVVRGSKERLTFDISKETLSRTLIGRWTEGDVLNLEPAMSAQDRFGGHLVSGHVDGCATLESLQPAARSTEMTFVVPLDLAPFIAEKGSVTLDGVSLTINAVADKADGVRFGVNLVPHTLSVTSLGSLKQGEAVHLEVDLVARYLKRLMDAQRPLHGA